MVRRAAVVGNSVHRRQLFHWIGSHLESDKGLTLGQRRAAYLECLRDSLDHGLWLTRSPQELEADHGGHQPRQIQPMVCFTDNRLSECAYHAQNYGKLGLGFPKRFVIDRFGGPVNYVSHKTRRNLYFKYFYELQGHLEETGADPATLQKLEYLMSFLKPISQRRKSPQPDASTPKKPPPPAHASRARRPSQEGARHYGPPLTYLVENEWRIVADKEVIRRLKLRPHPRFEEGVFETYLLAYKPLKDLFSVVFPDRQTLQMALGDGDLRRRLIDSPRTNIYVLDEVHEL